MVLIFSEILVKSKKYIFLKASRLNSIEKGRSLFEQVIEITNYISSMKVNLHVGPAWRVMIIKWLIESFIRFKKV